MPKFVVHYSCPFPDYLHPTLFSKDLSENSIIPVYTDFCLLAIFIMLNNVAPIYIIQLIALYQTHIHKFCSITPSKNPLFRKTDLILVFASPKAWETQPRIGYITDALQMYLWVAFNQDTLWPNFKGCYSYSIQCESYQHYEDRNGQQDQM